MHGTPYQPLGYVISHNGRAIRAESSIACFRKHAALHDSKHLEAFLSTLKVNPDGDDQGRRITWLDLYILYRIRGGIKPVPDDLRKAVSRATADKQIAAFKRKVKALTERVLPDDGDLKLFKQFKARRNVLMGCGILGNHPTLSFNVVVDVEESRAIAMALSKLIRTASNKKHNNFLNGSINLMARPLKLKGKAGWDSAIPTLSTCSLGDTPWADAVNGESIPPADFAMFFHCPRVKCNKVESSRRGVFQRVDLDYMHNCDFCKRPSAVKLWTCQCGRPWHGCKEHRNGYLLKPKDSPISARLLNGLPAGPEQLSCQSASRKRQLSTGANLRLNAKRFKGTILRGETPRRGLKQSLLRIVSAL